MGCFECLERGRVDRLNYMLSRHNKLNSIRYPSSLARLVARSVAQLVTSSLARSVAQLVTSSFARLVARLVARSVDRARNYTSCHVVSARVGSVNQAKGVEG